jgi:hypothetical protein
VNDAYDVLSALRLGWSVAEMRGRNRPDGPPGEVVGMPDHADHPLPLRIERGKTELRIEIQSVVAELAQQLRVDDAPDGTSYSAAQRSGQALYSQIRRWYELIVLGQDPTTLIGPAAVMRNYRTLARAFQLFWPQLLATVFGVSALITLLFLVNVDGATAWEKTLSGVLAAVGLSLAGLTGTLKNSAQALTKRLRQDAYTDLVALAVQTAPTPPDASALQRSIRHRSLTPATPN